ncbi:hypothetical protein BC629DRAFT_1297029 [Irpex lacteus]|nr:hypothetical protein BC629DRAFT_1297029 [Irpex lacteus]
MGLAARVYAEQLSTYGYGHPLWFPEPADEQGRTREIELGDVGYFDEDGGFRSLFNITVHAAHELNAGGVPEGFEPVEFNDRLRSVRDGYLQPRPYCSESVKARAVEAHASTNVGAIVDAELSYTFNCTSHRGAFLLLQDHATRASLGPNGPFEEYMLRHHANWYAFATDHQKFGIRCAKEDLVLVRGTMKTTSWTVGAFLGTTDSAHKISIGAQASAAASAKVSLSSGYRELHNCEQRSGPYSLSQNPKDNRRYSDGRVDATSRNQCIFLNIFKLKHRKLLPHKVVANGDLTSSDNPKDDSSDGGTGTPVSCAEFAIEMDPGFVPVSALASVL